MTAWQIITTQVKRNGNPFYPFHTRSNFARRMMVRAALYINSTNAEAAEVLKKLAHQ